MEFTTVSKTAKRWGVSRQHVWEACKAGRIPGAVFVDKHWRVPVDAEKPKREKAVVIPKPKMEGYLPVSKMAEKWGMNRVKVSEFCKDGRIPGAKRAGRNWYIPEDAEKPADGKTARKPGYVTATSMAKKWGTSRNFVCKACREGRIPGAEQIGRYWHIPEDAVNPEKERGGRRQ